MKHTLAVSIFLFLAPAFADVPPGQELEIDHLLNFVEHSSCRINRNGKFYDGSKAISHIKKKYAYFKDEIETTEQFIELSATKSTMSGKYYMVQCADGKQVRTKDWLLNELGNYRDNGNT
ncbi:MAG: DUF5329 domain-containing protein [Gammaproteobacteria bacterium]|nr:DUF5329 domain-containing protein [Gammaproteobacteria bacterium]